MTKTEQNRVLAWRLKLLLQRFQVQVSPLGAVAKNDPLLKEAEVVGSGVAARKEQTTAALGGIDPEQRSRT
jgi:hypothetical protein